MRYSFKTKQAGDCVARGEHKVVAYEVIVGNDIKHTNFLRIVRVYKTLITRSEVDGKEQHACHVIVTRFSKSRITMKRIDEAVESWKECIEELLNNK